MYSGVWEFHTEEGGCWCYIMCTTLPYTFIKVQFNIVGDCKNVKKMCELYIRINIKSQGLEIKHLVFIN